MKKKKKKKELKEKSSIKRYPIGDWRALLRQNGMFAATFHSRQVQINSREMLC